MAEWRCVAKVSGKDTRSVVHVSDILRAEETDSRERMVDDVCLLISGGRYDASGQVDSNFEFKFGVDNPFNVRVK